MDFSQLALIIGSAAIAGFIAKLLRQPLLIGYLFAGFVLTYFGVIGDTHSLEELGRAGVALLLFLVGLEMNIGEIRSIGKVAVLTGVGQIVFTSVFGFLLALSLGFGVLPSIYMAIALTFSSTIIIIKLLAEKNELNSLHGKISIGFLLVQDLVAIIILVALAGIGNGEISAVDYIWIFAKSIGLLLLLWLISSRFINFFYTKVLGSSLELMLTVTVAWALGLAAFVGGPLGLSIEIGGFLAGLTLSRLPEQLQLASRMRPMRDFFLTIFFIVLGSSLLVDGIGNLILPAAIFSVFVLVGNPIIVLVIMGILGYKKKTSFSASLAVAQISEFSLILMAMGLTVGQVSESEVALIILVGVTTMTLSTYMILNTEWIFKRMKVILSIFERKMTLDEGELFVNEEMSDHIVLVGADRTGKAILKRIKKTSKYVIVEYNPEIVEKLIAEKTSVVFGDIADEDIQDTVFLGKAKLVISTVPVLEDNLAILESLKKHSPKPKAIMNAKTVKEALTLYQHGATYVIVPDVLAGEHIRHVLRNYGATKKLLKAGQSHEKRIRKLLTT